MQRENSIAKKFVMPLPCSAGPSRTSTALAPYVSDKAPIPTSSPVRTSSRVEMFCACGVAGEEPSVIVKVLLQGGNIRQDIGERHWASQFEP